MDGLVVLLIGLGLYFLPAIIAASRNHHQLGPILIINLLLGWTLIGWVVALAMAASNVSPDAQLQTTGRRCPFCAELVQRQAVVCKHCGRDLPEVAHQIDSRPLTNALTGACSECGKTISADVAACPHCGVVFAAPPETV